VLRDDEKLEYYLVVADGRRPDSRGFSLADEGAFLSDKGCSIAYNLDGGGSSEMMFDGKIINIPSGGHERKDHDFIYVELWDGSN
jgi:exopolysaccharide biosynthesis protein